MIDEFFVNDAGETGGFRHAELLEFPDRPRPEQNDDEHCGEQGAARAECDVFEQAQRSEAAAQSGEQIQHEIFSCGLILQEYK